MLPALSHVDSWIFDLDNTLYPAKADLFGLIDVKMGEFIQGLLGCDPQEARAVQKRYFMEHGTDIKEALRFARQLLGSNRSANRQIILITDGEPTAATLDQGGRLHSGWGSAMLHGRIVRETLKEVRRCTQSGIKINTFMLGADFYRQGFVDQISRLNAGRVFYTSPDQMGNYIVVDYLANKRTRIGSRSLEALIPFVSESINHV